MAAELRDKCRRGIHVGPTAGYAPGCTQANIVILPKTEAYDFLLFCQRNPKPCPLLEVLDEGSYSPVVLAKNADIRTDVPMYRIFKKGKMVEQVSDIRSYWQNDFVTFFLGCSFTFESSLLKAGLGVRHIEQNRNVPMFLTNRECQSAGAIHGKLVVSMRPYRAGDISKVVQITSKFGKVHGAPVHIGDPAAIGIKDLSQPDYGDAVDVHHDEVPVFWACGVTPQAAAIDSGLPLMITHAPGCMFVADVQDDQIAMWD